MDKYEHDVVGKTYKVDRTGDYYALYKLDWTHGVPRHRTWVYVEAFFTQEQAHRGVQALPADAVVHWEV